MGKALYRAYRPKKLAEIVGQEHITDTLTRALEQDSISHAYLLTGPRGVGKTSIARILAYEVNKLPYDESAIHLDIIEIDAASNRRIDEIRDLKERVNVSPTSARYKVYIIDEVHMLTKEAFNALLKTLEEPPEHAIFILATTESHKVPETIISRTQRFTFKPVDRTKVIAHLKSIAKQEKITIDDDALELVAIHGDGSFRDSISLLDQVQHTSKHVTLKDVQQAIGQAPAELIEQLLTSTATHNASQIMTSLDELRIQGAQPAQIAKQLAARVRAGITDNTSTLSNHDSLRLLRQLLTVPGSHDPALALEIALYEIALDTNAPAPAQATVQVTTAPKTASNTPKPPVSDHKPEAKAAPKQPDTTKAPAPEPANTPKTATEEASIPKKTQPTEAHELTDETWPLVLEAIRGKYNTLYGICRMATANFDGNTLILTFTFQFHQKRLNDGKHQQALLNEIYELTGQNVSLKVLVDKNSTPPDANTLIKAASSTKSSSSEAPSVDLENISNIFGGAEIVE